MFENLNTNSLMLAGLIALPLLVGLVVAFAPARRAYSISLYGSLIVAGLCAILVGTSFDWHNGASFHYAGSVEWLRPLGISFSIGVDSVGMMLVILTVLLGPICVAASKTAITERVRTYYAWLMVLQAAMTGVFCARDLLLFYICFEFTLIPMYVLISLYGSINRKAAATKFFLYTFTGSIIALAGLVYVVWFNAASGVMPRVPSAGSGVWTFDIAALAKAAHRMSLTQQSWVMGALLLGFAVKVPLFPFHTWLPLAHTEAPTAGSVILAGVLLKLGTYGIYRFAMGFTPAAFAEYAPALAVLSIVGILYGGLICWVQNDVKKLVAYSSVAHLGFCILGLTAINPTGVTGSVMYMINHGLSTGALFLLIGMIYERYHTRNMKELGGLAAKMPVWATFMVFFTMASVGLPGLNGFVSEILCLVGAFQSSDHWGQGLWGTVAGQVPGASARLGQPIGGLGPWYAAVAGLGMIVAAIYLLYMVGKVVWGPLVEPAGHGGHGAHDTHATGKSGHHGHLPSDLTGREIGTLIPLAVLCLALGVYPQPALDALRGPVNSAVAMVWDNARPHGGVRPFDGSRGSPRPNAAAAPAHAPVASGEEAAR